MNRPRPPKSDKDKKDEKTPTAEERSLVKF
jgi:hypothetical protein